MTGTTTCVDGWDQTKDGDSEGNDSHLEVQAFRVKTLPDRLGEIQLTVGARDRPGKEGEERREASKQLQNFPANCSGQKGFQK